ncbi:MAG: FAD-dependent oxidoreductase, partial [Elusimicrobiota bacterium]
MKGKNFEDFGFLLTDKQFEAEIERCEYCEDKPCQDGCPADCSPADFIKAAEVMEDQDFKRAAAIVMKNNPLGGVCGMVCPDKHCMAECSHKLFDDALDIPTLQAEIVQRAKKLGGIPEFVKSKDSTGKIAVIGAGPAGLGAAGVLAQKGYKVEIFEARDVAGGMCNLIPDHRLDKEVLKSDIEFLETLGDIDIKLNSRVENFKELKDKGYEAVVVSTGLWEPIMPGAENEEKAVTAVDYLSSSENYDLDGNVGIIGGGATALDCAVTAKKNGAGKVEMFALENLSELPLTDRERDELVEYDIEVTGRTRVRAVNFDDNSKVESIDTNKLALEGEEFSLDKLKDIPKTGQKRKDIDHLIIAVGNLPAAEKIEEEGIFYAGDFITGPTTVVEAVASGKNSAQEVDSFLKEKAAPQIKDRTRSDITLPGYVETPVSLETDFFG